MQKENGWTTLYIRNARVYQPILEAGLVKAPAEALGLAKLFRKYGVRRSGRILDVSCGIGRHSIELAKIGYEVVGFDFSPYFLKTALKLARSEKLANDRLRFYQGDTRFLERTLEQNSEGQFDAIICTDGGMLRSTRKEELDLLRAMHSLTRNNGILALDMYSREFSERFHFSLYDTSSLIQYFPRARLERHLLMRYERKSKILRSKWRFYRRSQNDNLKHLLSVDLVTGLYSESDLRKILRRAKWRPIRSFSSFERLRTFTPTSLNLSMIARKE